MATLERTFTVDRDLPLDFTVDGVAMRKRRGVVLPIEAEEMDGMHTARAEKIGLDAFAETRAELAGEVREQLAMLWKEYALADDADLTESARRVKRNLLATFEEARRQGQRRPATGENERKYRR